MTKTKIYLDGAPIESFEYLSIGQGMYEHHEFELRLDSTATEPLGNHTMEKAQKWVGKNFVAERGDFRFQGIVWSVNLSQDHGYNSDLVVRGYSPTILLEAGAHLESWNDTNLEEIVTNTTSIASAGLSCQIKPQYTAPIGYMCQYKETHYDFLLRLAKQYNEWMYYDGLKLSFGKPDSQPTTVLTYGKDMDKMELSVRMNALGMKVSSYQSKNDQLLEGEKVDDFGTLNELARTAAAESQKHYPFFPRQVAEARTASKAELDEYLKRKAASAVSSLNWLTGSSTNPALVPGTVADLKTTIRKTLSFEDKGVGKYMVYRVRHYFGGLDEYTNSFEAIPEGVKVLPEPKVSLPVAEAQIATVLDNADPDGQGRVRVQMQWQTGKMKTPWVRVMTPDAGSSNKVSKNRGFVFIPEVGDQVLVVFRYNDPCRPFVLGSLFHGVVGVGGGSGNNTKSLSSKSGNKLELNDKEGSVYLTDHGSANMKFDGSGNATTNANNNHYVNAGSQHVANVGKEASVLRMDSGGVIDLSGNSKVTIKVGGSSIVIDGTSITIDSKNIIVSGKTSIDVSSPKNHIGGETKMDGGDVFIN
jgi:type VI secretion system secreted protein VgrG